MFKGKKHLITVLLLVAITSCVLLISCVKPQNDAEQSGTAYPFRTQNLTAVDGKSTTDFWNDGLTPSLNKLVSWAASEKGTLSIKADISVNEQLYKLTLIFSYDSKNAQNNKEMAAVLSLENNGATTYFGITGSNVYAVFGDGTKFVKENATSVVNLTAALPLATPDSTSSLTRLVIKLNDSALYGVGDFGKTEEYIVGLKIFETLETFDRQKSRYPDINIMMLEFVNTLANTSITSFDNTNNALANLFPAMTADFNVVLQDKKVQDIYLNFKAEKSDKTAFDGQDTTITVRIYGAEIATTYDSTVLSSRIGELSLITAPLTDNTIDTKISDNTMSAIISLMQKGINLIAAE